MAVTSQDALGELSNLMKSNVNLTQIVSHEWERVVGVITGAIRNDERKYDSETTRRRYLRYTPQWGMTEWDWENDRVLRLDELPEDSKEYFGAQGALVCLKRYLGCTHRISTDNATGNRLAQVAWDVSPYLLSSLAA